MTTPAVPPLVRLAGKGRQPEVVQQLRDAELELHALRTERDAIRDEIVTLRTMLSYAFGIDNWHLVLSVRDRLTSLTASLDRRRMA